VLGTDAEDAQGAVKNNSNSRREVNGGFWRGRKFTTRGGTSLRSVSPGTKGRKIKRPQKAQKKIPCFGGRSEKTFKKQKKHAGSGQVRDLKGAKQAERHCTRSTGWGKPPAGKEKLVMKGRGASWKNLRKRAPMLGGKPGERESVWKWVRPGKGRAQSVSKNSRLN